MLLHVAVDWKQRRVAVYKAPYTYQELIDRVANYLDTLGSNLYMMRSIIMT